MALNFIFKKNTNGICEVQKGKSNTECHLKLSNNITQVHFSVFSL